jgi:hypothetical protein
MLAGLVLLSWISRVFPHVLVQFGDLGWSTIRQVLAHGAAVR